MQFTHQILDRLDLLEQKFAVMGQDLLSYLDGLLYADYLTYWDYIHLDTLLSLQNPKTQLPDERIFIIYHQITELYFQLIIQAIEQVIYAEDPGRDLFLRQLKRVNNYFEHLIHSFNIMVDGMDKEEFLKFRMSLLPASGFQSAQYRQIEILSADLQRLAHPSKRDELSPDAPVADLFQHLYWKSGATELATGKKTLTLKQFEQKYAADFLQLAEKVKTCNLWQTYCKLDEASRHDEEIREQMREHDFNANVRWPLMHLRSAVRYLDNKPHVIAATGGTNWQEYLPPKNQRVIFYPELWTDEILDTWGKKMNPGH
ncbi:MAG: tryptophan 2,3-dioxygenase [Saprospiraceae bacterium]|nr:tryptophan 2,3-dioxygenase [Saprospiraceae bacterium]